MSIYFPKQVDTAQDEASFLLIYFATVGVSKISQIDIPRGPVDVDSGKHIYEFTAAQPVRRWKIFLTS